MKRLLVASFISLLFVTALIAQGSGTPNTLRVLTDANGYLVIVGAAQTNPTTQTVFSNTRLKTDANGYLQVVNTGGTVSSPFLAPQSTCSTPSYSFTGNTNYGINGTGSQVQICAAGGGYFIIGGGEGGPNSADLKFYESGFARFIMRSISSTDGKLKWLMSNGTTGVGFDVTTDGTLFVTSSAAADTAILKSNKLNLTGAAAAIGGVTTAGSFGVPPIIAVAETTGLTGADTNRINYTPAAASSTYELSGVVNVTAWATPASFTVVTTYKDASGNSRTDTALVVRGSTGASAAAVTAIDRWYFNFPAIDIDNSATAITLSTTGTFTGSPVYNFQGTLRRVR